MDVIKVSINRNGLLSKKITFKILNGYTIDFNKYVHNIDIFIHDKWRKYAGDSSKLQGDLNFAFDQREREVNLHKATSSPESPSNHIPRKVTRTYHLQKVQVLWVPDFLKD